ncbi:MAG: aminoacyl-tRNA hydrolase [Planctomycetaceae bacterium]|nr:aminoacyl-tRNA hydrolase [Planctomycetaceae bacterium]
MSPSETQLVINDSISIPFSEMDFAYVRSSGPGGQNVNKVSSQVQLSWDLTKCVSLPEPVLNRLRSAEGGRISKADVLRIDCQQHRDRERNRQECLDRLKEMVIRALQPPKRRRKTRVPRRAHEKRLEQKRQRADAKRSRRPPKMPD